MLTCDLIPSNHQKRRVLLIRLSLMHVVALVINRHSQGVKTIRPGVTRRAKQCNYYYDSCLIKVVILNGRFINGMITRWPFDQERIKERLRFDFDDLPTMSQ